MRSADILPGVGRSLGDPTRTYIAYPAPRAVSEWVEAGQVVAGHETNGLALPSRVVETLGRPGQPMYVAVGEVHYSDGRRFVDVAVSGAWAEEQRPPCADCGGLGGKHERVEYEDPKTGRTRRVMCPNAPRPRR